MIAGLLRERVLQASGGAYALAVTGSVEAAIAGRAPFKLAHDRLRLVCGLATLYLHIVTRTASGPLRFEELPRYRVSAGDIGFTTHAVLLELLRIARLSPADFRTQGGALVSLNYAEANRGLASGQLDAILSLTGLENPPYLEMARRGGVRLLPLEQPLIDGFLAENPGYAAGTIPAGSYPGCPGETSTLMSSSALITTSERGEDEVYGVARTLDANRADLIQTAPNYWTITPVTVAGPGLLQLHPGARRYWQEASAL